MLRRLSRWRVSPREIEAEFRAQIRWARERGVNLSHADSHYHVHVFPVAVGAFRRAAKAEGITRTRPQRHVVMPRPGILPLVHGGRFYRQLAVAAYMRMLQGVAFGQLQSPDYQLVLAPKDRSDVNRHSDGWRLTFESLLPGTYEAICHPALGGDELREIDNLGDRREIELRIMTDPAMKSAIQRRGVELITYHEL
jgi:chitin disaccharide deacetylase